MLSRVQFAINIVLVAVLGVFVWFEVGQTARSQESVRDLQESVDTLLVRIGELQALDGAAGAIGDLLPAPNLAITVGDTILISCLHNEELRAKKIVATDGKVLVPRVGWVFVAGMTRSEAEQVVTEACREYYVRADVRLEVFRREDPGN